MKQQITTDTLSAKELEWYSRLKLQILQNKLDYYCSWWLRLNYEEDEIGLTTAKINYWLTKLVDKGYLTKKANKSHTSYSLTDKNIEQ